MTSMTTLEKLGIEPDSGRDGEGEELIDGQWRLDGQLGYGAFGKVYSATDVGTGEEVALKIFKEDFHGTGYLQELGLMFGCKHPNIVEILSFGYTSGRKFIVYELVRGGSLRDYLIRYPRVPILTALGVLRESVRGLAFAHARNVLHRDLKPENILLSQPDWPFGCKLCDFGLSARFEPGERLSSAFGSPAYMAPEQFRERYDYRVDFYALGVIFYEMLFGRRPFSGGASSISHAHEHLEIKLPKSGPPATLDLLARLLSKDPDERYRDASKLLDDIEETRKEAAHDSVHTTVPVPERAQLVTEEAWQAMIRGGVEIAAPTDDGDLLFTTGGQLCRLKSEGDLEKLTDLVACERIIEGGGPNTTGWISQGELNFLRGEAVLTWDIPDVVLEGPFKCVLDRPGKRVAIVTPSAVYLYRISGQALWKASVETYGALPSLAFSESNLIWLATEAPRTQIMALTVEGEKVSRTSAGGSDMELIGADGDSVIVLGRGTNQLMRMDRSGFVEAEEELAESAMSLERVAADLVAAVSVSHVEVFESETLKPRGLLEYPFPEETAYFCRKGLFQMAELPAGSRIRHSQITNI